MIINPLTLQSCFNTSLIKLLWREVIKVMFKTRAAVFYRANCFTPNKTRAASFLNGFKNIAGKACVKKVHNNDAFVNVGN